MRFSVLALLCACALCACAQTRTLKTAIYKDYQQEIVLEREVDSEGNPVAKGYSHPVQFGLTDLKYLLWSIKQQEKGLFGWKEATHVFAVTELYTLGPHLVEAFARATPDDEIVFSSKVVKGGPIFASDRLTDGRMFVKDNKLNCLFANINIKPHTTNKYEGDPRKEYAGALVKLVPGDWQTLVDGAKGTHYNWLAMDYIPALARKKQVEERAKKRLKQIRTIQREKKLRETGWEEWEPGESIEREESDIEDDVVWPSEE
jgi:hypothetical protein